MVGRLTHRLCLERRFVRGHRMLQLADQRKEVVLLNHMLFGTLEVRGR
jgi:hypothetical protein